MSDRVHFFAGVDPAPAQGQKSDQGAIVVMRAECDRGAEGSSNESDWTTDLVYARVVKGLDAGEWSGLLHEKHQDFGFTLMLMDVGGGGQWILPELRKTRQVMGGQEVEVTPIVTRSDKIAVAGHFILCMLSRGDEGIKALWPDCKHARGDDCLKDYVETLFRTALEKQQVGIPRRFSERHRDELAGWSEERYWAGVHLTTLVTQCLNTTVLTKADGSYAMTKNNARQFACKGKDDIKDAARNAYAAFRIWLSENLDGYAMSAEDEAGCG